MFIVHALILLVVSRTCWLDLQVVLWVVKTTNHETDDWLAEIISVSYGGGMFPRRLLCVLVVIVCVSGR